MVISKNSQLGLRFMDNEVKADYLRMTLDFHKSRIDSLTGVIDFIKSLKPNEDGTIHIDEQDFGKLGDELEYDDDFKIKIPTHNRSILIDKITMLVEASSIKTIINEEGQHKYFLICDSVYKAAELIKIGENFTSRTLKDIELGKYTYLMGKHQMVRFVCVIGAIKGFYYDDEKRNAFEFGLDIETGEFYAPKDCVKEFSMIMQVLAFVELGDIEVLMLEGGRNNGKTKKEGKITNTSNNTVYVVDSSWNKLIIRTTGFAVRGHFRLQPCGHALADRKLIWVDAFEKHGYKRRAKAEIIHS